MNKTHIASRYGFHAPDIREIPNQTLQSDIQLNSSPKFLDANILEIPQSQWLIGSHDGFDTVQAGEIGFQ